MVDLNRSEGIRRYIAREIERLLPGKSITISRMLLMDVKVNPLMYRNSIHSVLGIVAGSSYNIIYTEEYKGDVTFHRLEKESETTLRNVYDM